MGGFDECGRMKCGIGTGRNVRRGLLLSGEMASAAATLACIRRGNCGGT